MTGKGEGTKKRNIPNFERDGRKSYKGEWEVLANRLGNNAPLGGERGGLMGGEAWEDVKGGEGVDKTGSGTRGEC